MIFKKVRYENGKRDFFVFGKKIFSYYSDKLKGVRRNCDIPYEFAKYLYREKNLKIIHQVGVVIASQAHFGNNCTVFQNTTIGMKNGYAPTIGDNVTIYANSVIVGNVHIGNNAQIGAGSIVLKDVPANEIWAGNPARFVKKINTNE